MDCLRGGIVRLVALVTCSHQDRLRRRHSCCSVFHCPCVFEVALLPTRLHQLLGVLSRLLMNSSATCRTCCHGRAPAVGCTRSQIVASTTSATQVLPTRGSRDSESSACEHGWCRWFGGLNMAGHSESGQTLFVTRAAVDCASATKLCIAGFGLARF